MSTRTLKLSDVAKLLGVSVDDIEVRFVVRSRLSPEDERRHKVARALSDARFLSANGKADLRRQAKARCVTYEHIASTVSPAAAHRWLMSAKLAPGVGVWQAMVEELANQHAEVTRWAQQRPDVELLV